MITSLFSVYTRDLRTGGYLSSQKSGGVYIGHMEQAKGKEKTKIRFDLYTKLLLEEYMYQTGLKSKGLQTQRIYKSSKEGGI